MEMTSEIASRFANIALGHVAKPFPYKDDHVFEGEADLRLPQEAHPCFFGSFDWHSCVHSWWMLMLIRRVYPEAPESIQIEELADATFTPDNCTQELAYLDRPSARGFERPYGWGWLLYLHLEAAEQEENRLDENVPKPWAKSLYPLARAFAQRLKDYLEVLTYPITVGTHFNTSFALILALEWADEYDFALAKQIRDYAEAAFAERSNYSGWEPGGDEFLSPVLTVALLMSRVMPPDQFQVWFDALVIANGWIERECHPVTVSDRSDGKIAHLDGLNLSRAWCLREISKSLGTHPATDLIEERAKAHLDAAMPHVAGDYMGEHWLASFATLALLAAD